MCDATTTLISSTELIYYRWNGITTHLLKWSKPTAKRLIPFSWDLNVDFINKRQEKWVVDLVMEYRQRRFGHRSQKLIRSHDNSRTLSPSLKTVVHMPVLVFWHWRPQFQFLMFLVQFKQYRKHIYSLRSNWLLAYG